MLSLEVIIQIGWVVSLSSLVAVVVLSEVANCFQIVTIHSNRSDHLLLFLYERVSINYLY